MISALTSKRRVLVLLLAAGCLVLVAGAQVWVSGSVDDGVLGAGALHARGSDVAPGALAAALVGLASAVAAATAGAVVRVLAATAALLAAVLGAAVVISVLAAPGGALGRLAAASTGRSGTVAAHGRVAPWAWVALVAMLVMGVAALGALIGGRHWRGLSSRYDSPAAGQGSLPGSPGQAPPRRESAWEQLSRGEDPTAEH